MKRLLLTFSRAILISMYVISIYGSGESVVIKENEYPICKPEQGEPFIPIFYSADVNYLRGIVRSSREIWKDVTQIEGNINKKGWIEMLEAAVEENDYYYENCFSPEGNWCRRDIAGIGVDRGVQFKCSPRFKVIGTFQYHSVISKLLENVDCSYYRQKDKCDEVVGCFWYEVENPRCLSKSPGQPLMSQEECEKIYNETGMCPKECMIVESFNGQVIEYRCVAMYCDDLKNASVCNDYPDKCEWTKSICIKADDCSVYNNNLQQCNRIPICEVGENSCYSRSITWQQFLVYHYYTLFKKLSSSKKQSYSKKFFCNVGELSVLDLETLTVEYNGVGLAASGSRYSEYHQPVPDEWALGHEIGHNSGLGHYWYSQDSYIGGPGNEGVFDTTILRYLIEDLGTKYYGKSKDRFGRVGRYGYMYNIYKRETTEDVEHKLKSIVYAIEECAQKHSKSYRAGGEGVPMKATDFKKFSHLTDEECEKDEECLRFVQDAISYYKDYLSTLHKGSCDHCVIEECFLGEKEYRFINYMAYTRCPQEGCKFDRYQIYRRTGEGVGGNVLEWLYMSQYPIYYTEQGGRYFDLKFREGTYFNVEKVKNIFKELANLAGISDYKVPVFEEGGENSVDVGVFQFVKDGLYDTLLHQAADGCDKRRSLVEGSLEQLQKKIKEESQHPIVCPFNFSK